MESVARVREEVTAAPDANDNNKRQRVVTEAAASRTESKLPASQTEAKDWPQVTKALDFWATSSRAWKGRDGLLRWPDELREKNITSIMDIESCSREHAELLILRHTREVAEKQSAEDAKAKAAMAARPHPSGTVWAILESPYCKYHDSHDICNKPKLHSVHLSEEDATRRAKLYWTHDTCDVDGLMLLSKSDEPYLANACVEGGSGVMAISVVHVPICKLKGSFLKEALLQRGASANGKVPELRARLTELVG
jgi:hypothetical protein